MSEKPKFAMDFVGFSSMGTPSIVEASIALTPEYDIKAVVSSHVHKDGSRVVTLVFGRSDGKLGRKGYSLKEEWTREPQNELENCENKEQKVKP